MAIGGGNDPLLRTALRCLLGPPVAVSEISRSLDTILTVVNTDKAKRFDHSGCHRKLVECCKHPFMLVMLVEDFERNSDITSVASGPGMAK